MSQEFPRSEEKTKKRPGWEEINAQLGLRKDGRFESGRIYSYCGYPVELLDDDGRYLTPAWPEFDPRYILPYPEMNRWSFRLLRSVPKQFLLPLIVHEKYELEGILGGKDISIAHREAVGIGRRKAEELGILPEFLQFEKQWEDLRKKREERNLSRSRGQSSKQRK